MLRYLDNAEVDLDALFNASPNSYLLLDTSLKIVSCNDAYLKAVGRIDRSKIVGRYLFDAFPSDPRSESPSRNS